MTHIMRETDFIKFQNSICGQSHLLRLQAHILWRIHGRMRNRCRMYDKNILCVDNNQSNESVKVTTSRRGRLFWLWRLSSLKSSMIYSSFDAILVNVGVKVTFYIHSVCVVHIYVYSTIKSKYKIVKIQPQVLKSFFLFSMQLPLL